MPTKALDRSLGDGLTALALGKAPSLRPKDAATLIILDRRGRSAKVLMGRRHEGHVFMPGKFVFPGGRVEIGDRTMAAAGTLHARGEAALLARIPRPSPTRARALALAAIRETFEETGFLIGTKEYGAPDNVPSGTWSVFQKRGVFPDLESLQVVARAITPPQRPKRFDTRFFAVDRSAIGDQVEGMVGPESELVELAWVTLKEAASLDLPRITVSILKELGERLEKGFFPELPVPFFYEKHRRSVRDLL